MQLTSTKIDNEGEMEKFNLNYPTSSQRRAFLFCFHDAHQLAVNEQGVVGRAGGGGVLPHGDSGARAQVQLLVVLHDPARGS